jgi:protein SCO1/2
MKHTPMPRFQRFPFALILAAVLLTSCHRSPAPAVKRYPFTGRVVAIQAGEGSAIIDGDDIAGFMSAMAMTYKIKPPSTLTQLAPGDSISAEVVVVEAKNKDDDSSDYWLENVKVTAHAKTPPAKTGSRQRLPAPGDDVPDFSFTSQGGQRVSLKQYRGKVLLLTFIYTRCPFPDFCPRISSNFVEIDKQLGADQALADGTRLLSVSFDPEHDTPKVLRDYAFSVAHTREPALFDRWEFVSPSSTDLAKLADFFGVVYKSEGGLITHNLSTTVIGRDGKIVKWYQGGDWQVSDLIKDATNALGQKGQA